MADEIVELIVPLAEGRYYSLRDLHRESQQKLRGDVQGTAIADRQIELRREERLLLQAYAIAFPDLLQVRITDKQLMIRLPDRQDDGVRRRNRRRLGQLLGVSLEEWPPDKGLHLPDKFRPDLQTVVLIHGLESTSAAMNGLAEGFRARGVQVLSFDYPNNGPVAWSGERLNAALGKLSVQQPQFRTAIVAHSLGGLVARYALECSPHRLSCVTDLFTLATPHEGSRLAEGQDWLHLVSETSFLMPQSKGKWGAFLNGMGEAADDLRPGSRLLRQLNDQSRPKAVRYHCGIGQRGLLNEQQANLALREIEKLLVRREVPAARRHSMLTFLREAEELRSGLGDGVVSVRSARLRGATTERLFDLTHLQFLEVSAETPDRSPVLEWVLQTWGKKQQ